MGAGFDDLAGEGQPVDDGGAESGVGEGFGPGREGFNRGDRDRGAFFSFGQDLEEQFGAAAVELFLYAAPERVDSLGSDRLAVTSLIATGAGVKLR